MFAVPGWSLDSSSLKHQTIAAKPAQAKPTDAPKSSAEDGDGASGKKRKRSGGKEVNKNNLSDMWEQVIEGKPKPKKVKKDKEITSVESKDVKDGGAGSKSVGEGEGKSKKKDKKEKKEGKDKKAKAAGDVNSTVVAKKEISIPTPAPPAPPPATKLTPLQAAMRQKLISARFRHLNQTLYTTPSTQSLDLVTADPAIFNEYHEGFRRQVEVWPENPVDGYIKNILARGGVRSSTSQKNPTDDPPLPRSGKDCTIADLGCGDAALSHALQPHLKKLALKVHSFDLHSPSPLIIKADIASLPLADNSVDVAIFCLALMGTNWIDFIEEAFRILRWKGELWISEIKSRFSRAGSASKVVDHSVGKRQKNASISQGKEMKKSQKHKQEIDNDAFAAVEVDGQPSTREETDVSAFVEVLRRRGFVLKGEGRPGGEKEGVDLKNKMFVKMWFVKGGKPTKGKGVKIDVAGEKPKDGTWKHKSRKGDEVKKDTDVGDEGGVLKPCVYKLR